MGLGYLVRSPIHLYQALLVAHAQDVRAILTVNRNPSASGDVAHNVVTRQWIAAASQVGEQVAYTINSDAGRLSWRQSAD